MNKDDTSVTSKEEVVGFAVKDHISGRLIHKESVLVGKLNDDAVTDLLVRRRERLERRYPVSGYEVEAGLFSSVDAFDHFFPDDPKDS